MIFDYKILQLALFLYLFKLSFELPENFSYLDTIDPTILVNLKYFSTENFMGERVPYYNVNRAIMTTPAANALKCAQDKFKNDGYSILVYDAYRPDPSVKEFVKWMNDKEDMRRQKFHYPYVIKKNDMKDIYISSRSGHSRGSTVDITLVSNETTFLKHAKYIERTFNRKIYPFNDDNTVDCGTSFDLMDPLSWINDTHVSEEQNNTRNYIREIMESCNFKALKEEWWHFTLKDEPFPDTYFNFTIE